MAGVPVVLKLAVVGEDAVGKSCIIARYVDGQFAPSRSAAAGIDFRNKAVTANDLAYFLQIWDTGNWRLLSNLGVDFWKDVNGCVVVFNVTKASSFGVLDELCEHLRSVGGVPFVVVGNKIDQKPREVPTERAESWCRTVGAPYFEASAKTGVGLSETFLALAEKAAAVYRERITISQSQKPSKGALRFALQLPLKGVKGVKKVRTSVINLGRRSSQPANSTKENRDEGPIVAVHSSPPTDLCMPLPEQEAITGQQFKQLQEQLEIERAKSQSLQEKYHKHEKEIAEKVQCLKGLESQLAELQRALGQKEAACEALETVNQALRQHVEARSNGLQQCIESVELRSTEQKQYHSTTFWEVSRGEVELDAGRIVGTGAWGYVVEGRFRGQKVAVKCLHSVIQQPHFLQTIRREIDIMAQLRHPNLLLFIAVVLESETGPLIITELLDTSLRRAYEQHQLHPSNTVRIFREVAAALNYLHLQGSGIIHRDVSSANVLLEAKPEQQWKAKLSDFGSANLIRQSSTVGPGAMVYAAPEVRRECSTPQTPKLDVFSFGVLMCEVLLCEFPSLEQFEQMLGRVKARWPAVHTVAHSCTRDKPEERPTVAVVLAQLNDIART